LKDAGVGLGDASADDSTVHDGSVDSMAPDTGTAAGGSSTSPDAAPSDGSAGDATSGPNPDGGIGTLCPETAPFPVGTYHLNLVELNDNEGNGNAPIWPDLCSLSRVERTLTIEMFMDFPGTYDARITAADPYAAEFIILNLSTDDGPKLRVSGDSVEPLEHIEFDIDRDTRIISNFEYSLDRAYPNGFVLIESAGNGWPICATTEAHPPRLPSPTRPKRDCSPAAPAIGCSVDRIRQEDPVNAPSCADSDARCPGRQLVSCTDDVGYPGYTIICCQ
jgi:hypothetical protein